MAPVLDGIKAGLLGVAATTVRGTAEANANIAVLVGAAMVATGLVDATGHWSAGMTLADGSHSITAIATDAAGNASTASGATTVTVNTAPSVVVTTLVITIQRIRPTPTMCR